MFIRQKLGELPRGESRYELVGDDITFVGDTEEDILEQHHLYKLEHNTEYKNLSEDDESLELTVNEIITEDYHAGMVSLVGIMADNYPVAHGNYWSIYIEGKLYPVVNMWHENFEQAKQEFGITACDFKIVNNVCIISENKIPKNWYLEKLFLKYNLHEGISHVIESKLNEWYENNR